MDDDRQIKAYLKGDLAAFDCVYQRYKDRLYGYLYRSSPNEQVAEELFQEVWLKVLIGLENYNCQGRFRSWLFVYAHNVIVDHYRKKQIVESNNVEVEKAVSEFVTCDSAVEKRIHAALATLPLEQRQAFYLREELSCSLKEIAEIQDCGLEAAKSRLRYAYGKLREQLEDLVPTS